MRILALIVAGSLGLPGIAFAADGSATQAAGCQTKAKSICAPIGAARLTSATGDVLLSRGAGFAEIKAGTALVAGDRLLIKQGSAKLALGPTCRATLGAQSMVTMVQKDGSLCAASLSSDPAVLAVGDPEVESTSLFGGGLQAPVIIGGVVVATGVAIALVTISR